MLKSFGANARKVNQRVMDLSAAPNLSILRTLPSLRCHELSGERKGALAVDVSGNYRLIFVPDHEPIPLQKEGGLDWSRVTQIRIISVEDYH